VTGHPYEAELKEAGLDTSTGANNVAWGGGTAITGYASLYDCFLKK
jgi:hypothetical protein